MKDKILKIAKVKSEKEFYKKYPTEEAFMKAHGKAFKKAAMGSKMVNDQLHQLTSWDNPTIAEDGTTAQPQKFGFTKPESFGAGAETAGLTALQNLDKIAGGIEAIGAQKKAIKKAEQSAQLSGLALQAQQGVPQPQRKYVRPEDSLVQPGQLGNPYGTGTNYLQAEDGAMIGGNPTQIQNTYANTGDIYQDLGYEPLTKENYKQYKKGGRMPKAEFGEYFQDSGQAQIGSAVGESIGSAFGPAGAAVGKFAGKILGNALGGAKDARALQAQKDKAALAQSQMGFEQTRSQGALHAYMKDGGWVSNDWQPQTFTKFGDYSAKQLLAPPHDADMLRSGGHLAQVGYTAPSEEALSTERPDMPQAQFGIVTSPLNIAAAAGLDAVGRHRLKNMLKEAPMLLGAMDNGGRMSSTNMMFDTDRYPRAQSGAVLDSNIRSKTDLQTMSSGNNFNENLRHAISSTDTYADGRPVEKTDLYSITKGRNDNQRVKEFIRTQTGDGAPQYSMQKTYKPLFSDQYKTVSREIGAGRGERRMADMEQFLSEGKMEYGGQLAMGGELEVGDGGRLETLSYNPNLPGGEIGMFRGASHDNGGIKTKYGENEVEVEGGEPAVKLQDGGKEDNLVVFGNIKINNNIADLMGDPKAKGKKFKTYIADVAKNDAKQLKNIQKGLDLIDQYDGNSSYDRLGMNSGMANLIGGNAWQKINADKIKEAGLVQDAIHQTANEYGVKSDKLAEGKLEKETDPSMMGKNGKKMRKAQEGIETLKGLDDEALLDPEHPERMEILKNYYSLNNADREMMRRGMSQPGFMGIGATDLQPVEVTGKRFKSKGKYEDYIPMERAGIPLYEPLAPQMFTGKMPDIKMNKGKRKFHWPNINWNKLGTIGAAALSNLEPWLRPSNANEQLSPDQLMGEYYALANNQLEPVQAQQFYPMLDTPYDISLNDQINAIDSQSRAAIRAGGNNPAAQAMIMAQTLEAKNRVLGEQSRINQANKMQVYDRNRSMLNDAQLKNLQILDQQYVRQAQAKSNTKEQTQAALNSIAAKITQQRAANRKLAVLENLYNFRFSPSGKAINANGLAQFNMSGNINQAGQFRTDAYGNKMYPIYNPKTGNIKGYSVAESSGPSAGELDDVFNKNGGKTSKTKARNSSIVKALKNL